MLAFLLAAPPPYRIVDLGLPPGAKALEAIALNNRGELLTRVPLRLEPESGKNAGIYPGHGYLWRKGRFLNLGEPRGSKYDDPPSVWPTALNESSTVVGYEGQGGPIFMSGLLNVYPFIWQGGRKVDLGSGRTSQPVGINAHGDVVGDSDHRAFVRLDGKIRVLGTLSRVGSGNRASGVAINDRRQILLDSTYGGVKGQIDASLPSRPVLVDGNDRKLVLRPLPLPKGYADAQGYDLNEAGTVLAGGYSPGMGGTLLYLVRKGKIQTLRTPSGSVGSVRINEKEEVVATISSGTYPSKTRPALWRKARPIPFPTFPGWTLQTATGINDAGAICGSGLHNGKPRAYLLIPR